jgi:hypothetical protein
MTTGLRVAICGSFNGALPEVAAAVDYFNDSGQCVVSPVEPTPVERIDEFLFVSSDRWRDSALVEGRHLTAIATADFVWLVAPQGYVGFSAAAEIGFAVGRAVPIFTSEQFLSEPLASRVAHRVSGPEGAIECVAKRWRSRHCPILLDVEEEDAVHTEVANLCETLRASSPETPVVARELAAGLRRFLTGL